MNFHQSCKIQMLTQFTSYLFQSKNLTFFPHSSAFRWIKPAYASGQDLHSNLRYQSRGVRINSNLDLQARRMGSGSFSISFKPFGNNVLISFTWHRQSFSLSQAIFLLFCLSTACGALHCVHCTIDMQRQLFIGYNEKERWFVNMKKYVIFRNIRYYY